VWAGPLSNASFAVVVVNRFDAEKFVSLDWALDAKIPHGLYTVQVGTKDRN
jgi:hypothetical protein